MTRLATPLFDLIEPAEPTPYVFVPMPVGTILRQATGGPPMSSCEPFADDDPDEVRCRWVTGCGEGVYAKVRVKTLVCLIEED